MHNSKSPLALGEDRDEGPEPPEKVAADTRAARATTIADVARHAGVAKTTVSYVLNDSGFVSEERRARILRAVDELDYRPNINARSLRHRGLTTLGFACSALASGDAARILDGVRDEAERHGIRVVLCSTVPASGRSVGLGLDGLIACSSCNQSLAEHEQTENRFIAFDPHVAGTVPPHAHGVSAVRQFLNISDR